MRTFIAVEIPEDLKSKLMHISGILERGGLIKGTFVSKENFHLTLKFLGDLPGEDLEKITNKLNGINFKKFEAKVDKIGVFPSEEYVKVVWIGVISPELESLSKKINESLSEIGFPQDVGKFENHLTIARVKSIVNKASFKEKLKNLNVKNEKFSIENFHLIKSELTPKGPIYRKIASFNLK